MGSDRHTVPFARRTSGWTNNHSIDAGLMSASVSVQATGAMARDQWGNTWQIATRTPA